MYEFPKVSQLDPSADEYPAELDAGLRQVTQCTQRLDEQSIVYRDNRQQKIFAMLREVPGVEIISDQFSGLSDSFRDSLPTYIRDLVELGSPVLSDEMPRASWRQMEDGILEIIRNGREERDDLEDRQRYLLRAGQDYRQAIEEMTVVTQLCPFSEEGGLESVHFFAPREDGVYIMQLECQSGRVHGPEIHEGLCHEWLTNPEIRAEAYSNPVRGAVAFLVENPCTAIPVSRLMTLGVEAAGRAYAEHLIQQGGPGGVDSILATRCGENFAQ